MMKLTIVFILILLSSCVRRDNQYLWENHKNVAVFLHNNALNKENQSIRISIGDSIIFESDSVSKKKERQDFELQLDKGKHLVNVETLEGRLKSLGTIEVKKIPQRYLLSISYQYNPSLEWFKEHILQQTYVRTLINNQLKRDTVIQWVLDSIENDIERGCKEGNGYYQPTERQFVVNFDEQAILE